LGVCANQSIVNVGSDDYAFVSGDENAFVGVRGREAKGDEFGFLVVGIEAASLFESIDTFVDFEDVIHGRIIRMRISFGLFEVDLTVNERIQKSGFDVKKIDELTASGSEGKCEPDGGRLGDGGKGVFIIDVSHLSEAFGDETCFEASIWAFRILDFEGEFGSDDLSITGTMNDGVGAMF
jgi:hypothetical protein